jgi:glutamate-1-semialdehyde 2,1-aminomutase
MSVSADPAAAGFRFPTERSRALFERLGRTLPGANTRTATYFPPYPLALSHGDGAHVWDADGNRLIDLVNNYTSLVHGHAHPAVTEAIAQAAATGTVFPSPIAEQAELAERICARVDSVQRLRFTNSGTEATMHALRLARAATGRELVVKAHDGYHGSADTLPSSLGATRGVPAGVLDTIRWVDYNAPDQLAEVVAREGERIAAIVLEPVLGAGVLPAERAFLVAARAAADRCGALLVLDEVVTFRLHVGGWQAELGVTPDLTTFGKLIGGGLPVGAFGGRAALLDLYDPRAAAVLGHHGTFNGNALTMAAGIVSLDLLTAEEVARINALGARLADGLRSQVAAHGLDAVVTEAGSLVQVHFEAGPVMRCGADLRPGSALLARFHREALEEGVYVAPRGELNVTTAMDEAIVDEALAGIDRALARIAAGDATPA